MRCEHRYNYISFSCKCTRDEYLAYCVNVVKKPVWTTVFGGILLALSMVLAVLEEGQLSAITLLGLLLGALLVMFSPLILPMIVKGEAAKRFDDKNSELQNAITVTIEDNVLSFTTASREGKIPLLELTKIVNNEKVKVLGLVFGKELTLLIPWRALDDDEYGTLMSILEPHFKSVIEKLKALSDNKEE